MEKMWCPSLTNSENDVKIKYNFTRELFFVKCDRTNGRKLILSSGNNKRRVQYIPRCHRIVSIHAQFRWIYCMLKKYTCNTVTQCQWWCFILSMSWLFHKTPNIWCRWWLKLWNIIFFFYLWFGNTAQCRL